MAHDKAPSGNFDAANVPEATPKWEPISPQGNKSPYQVLGKTYEILSSNKNYIEEGVSSWYGLKFHGELTSNGEVYDMYALSAAHKTLPIPTYLRVTNLANGKKIIVRVNDRGPFHGDRLIDLSYAAAIKLGFQKQGTTKVKLEAINTAPPASVAISSTEMSENRLASFVQVAAFGARAHADALAKKLRTFIDSAEVFTAQAFNLAKPLFRVRIGPFDSDAEAQQVMQQVKDEKVGQPIVIVRSLQAKGA
jgi:rare lipoprotein A